jgi:hypothetical protein
MMMMMMSLEFYINVWIYTLTVFNLNM